MKKGLIETEHLTISLTLFVIMLVVIFASFTLIKDFWLSPGKYLLTDLSNQEIQFGVFYISLIVNIVFLTYIIYLLLASGTRTELSVLEATKSLEKTRQQFEKLYESAPMPYITLNKKGEITKANKAALRFFGVVNDEIKGQNIFSYQPEEDLEKTENIREYYYSHIPIDRKEIRMVTKSGEIKWVLLTIFEMIDFRNYENIGLAAIFDITERKILDEAKSAFVSLASHQLRTPVATVKWYIESMLSGVVGDFAEKQKQYLERIYRSNKDMLDLIETLLNISRIEIGKLIPDLSTINVSTLCESVLEELSYQISNKKIKIEKNYGGHLENIESDPKLLRIVIQNIISNAIKYTRDGGMVKIVFDNHSITVIDNGIGIPKEDQSKIFTKLYRASNAKNIEHSYGTGLGLYLVKSIMRALNGDINFSSEEGKGSTFIIEF